MVSEGVTVFIQSALIGTKRLINLKCFSQRKLVKSGRIMTGIIENAAYCTLCEDVVT